MDTYPPQATHPTMNTYFTQTTYPTIDTYTLPTKKKKKALLSTQCFHKHFLLATSCLVIYVTEPGLGWWLLLSLRRSDQIQLISQWHEGPMSLTIIELCVSHANLSKSTLRQGLILSPGLSVPM